MKIIKFGAGLAIGYVLGSRAGREKYEQIVAAARKAQSHPAVTQVQQKAKELLGTDTNTLTADTDISSEAGPTGTATPIPRPARQSRNTPKTPSATADPLM